MRRALAFLTLIMVAPAATAFEAQNGVTVDAGNGLITPRDGGGLGARGQWCAAADYARVVLGAGWTDRLHVAQARDSLRAPVGFALGKGAADSSVFIVGTSLRRQGAHLSVGHAYGFCADARIVDW